MRWGIGSALRASVGLNVELTLADADGVGDILREDGEAAGNGWRITDGSEQKGVDSSCARLLSQLKGTPRPVIDEIKGRSTRVHPGFAFLMD